MLIPLVALTVLVASSPASASFDPLGPGSGTLKLTLDKRFAHLLKENGAALLGAKATSARANTYTLPVSGGILDPIAGKAKVETEGADLLFTSKAPGRALRRLSLRDFTLRINRQPLSAKVGGGQLKLVSAAKTTAARKGFGSVIRASHLRLSAKLATRLDKKLRLPGVFAAGQLLGTLRAQITPTTLAVEPTGRVSLTPDPAFAAKLDSLFVSTNPVAPAERASGSLFTFPLIPAGTIAPDGSSGIPRSGGSLEFLQLGAGQVFWHELWFDLGSGAVLGEVDVEPTPTFPGKLGQLEVARLDLASATRSSDPDTRSVTLMGALTLSARSAATFNEAFAKPQGKAEVFASGEPIGAVSFIAEAE